MGAETPKQFLELEGVPIVMLSLRRIASCELITDIIVATRGDGIARLEEQIRAEKFKQTVGKVGLCGFLCRAWRGRIKHDTHFWS